MAPIGEDIQVPNVLEEGLVTIPRELRPYFVDMSEYHFHTLLLYEATFLVLCHHISFTVFRGNQQP